MAPKAKQMTSSTIVQPKEKWFAPRVEEKLAVLNLLEKQYVCRFSFMDNIRHFKSCVDYMGFSC